MKLIAAYSEIGTKSGYVQDKMLHVLRQRVEDRLRYEELDFEKVSRMPGRIVADVEKPEAAAEYVAELPGVKWAAAAETAEHDLESIIETALKFEYGQTFGVDTKRSAEFEYSSQEISREVGAVVEDEYGLEVDLDNPDTWLSIEIRKDNVFIYTDKLDGIGGLPVGTQGKALAMISGGIDSPVAAIEAMKRGVDITPIYFYNKPIAAEDHWLRFQAAVEKLKRFHPGKDWTVYRVDLEDENTELMEGIDRGRMVVHRQLMFDVATEIMEEDGFDAIITGESIGQKSSQTLSNLKLTGKPWIHRPLLTWNKHEIVERAKQVGTFENASIASACQTLSPDNPATKIDRSDLEEMKADVEFEGLVESASDKVEKH